MDACGGGGVCMCVCVIFHHCVMFYRDIRFGFVYASKKIYIIQSIYIFISFIFIFVCLWFWLLLLRYLMTSLYFRMYICTFFLSFDGLFFTSTLPLHIEFWMNILL